MKNIRKSIHSVLCFLLIAIAAANERPPVVAVAEFNSRLHTYESQRMARNLADQVVASLTQSESLRLVERAQLELAANELDLVPLLARSAGESIAVGRWVGADLVMLGSLERNAEGLWTLWMEVVDTVDADVLAEGSVAVATRPDQQPELVAEVFVPVGERLIREAWMARARNREASLVMAPLFFDFIGKLRNLEQHQDEFTRELEAQAGAGKDLRLLHFPRVEQVQQEMEMRLDGFTAMSHREPDRNAVFFWGDYEELDAEGKQPDEVVLRARVNLRTNNGEQREIVVSRKAAQVQVLMRDLVRAVLENARQLSTSPVITRGPSPVEAGKLRAHAQKLLNEFNIREKSGEPVESQRTLGHHIDSLYQLAAFLSPDNPDLAREHLMVRYSLLEPETSLHFPTYLEINRGWTRYDARFPNQHTTASLNWSTHYPLLLLDCKRRMRGVPKDWPPQLWKELNAGLQKQIIERLKAAGPEAMMKDTNFANYMHYHIVFVDAEKRAEFTEMIWPVFVEHMKKFRNDLQDWERWEKALQEIFSAVGRPERAKQLVAMRDLTHQRESSLPEDLRFMVRRPDVLPPEIDCHSTVIQSGEILDGIGALHHDGSNLWVAAVKDRASTTNETWRQRIVELGNSNKLYRLQSGSVELKEMNVQSSLPSRICALTSDDKHLWVGTQQHGILQIALDGGAVTRKWDISTGLPTHHVYALAANGKSVLAGGGDRHRGHFFQIADGVEGAVNLSVPGWSEKLAPWRSENVPKSEFGEISILHRAHGQTLVVAGEAQAILLKDGGKQGLNLTEAVLGGDDSRYGASGQNGSVIAVTHDKQGWWLGSDVGLARLSRDGAVTQRWNTPVGGDFFEQKGWVPSMRTDGTLRRNFYISTRLVGAVTALEVDGDFLFAAVSTETDEFLSSPVEGAHLYVLHIPSGKWVGRVNLPARVTAIAQDQTRLWLGHDGPCSVLLEYNKAELTNVSPEHYVSNAPTAGELGSALAKLSNKEQACHAFFNRDYSRVLGLLGGLAIDTATVGELFLIAYSCDKEGLNQPELARACFEEILRRKTHSFWRDEANQGLKSVGKAAARGGKAQIQAVDFPLEIFLRRGELPDTPANQGIEEARGDGRHPVTGPGALRPEMISVEGGSHANEFGRFAVGSFSISKTEVTWSQWEAVQDWAAGNGYDLDQAGGANGDQHPVTHVSWYDAVKWCNAASEMAGLKPAYLLNGQVYRTLQPPHFFGQASDPARIEVEWVRDANGYRLPTEAEWEFAARSGVKSRQYQQFSGGNQLDEVAWFRANSERMTHEVARKSPNALGIHDMSGNVAEWCWDSFENRMRFRGGNFGSGSDNCASSSFLETIPMARMEIVGMRVARSAEK